MRSISILAVIMATGAAVAQTASNITQPPAIWKQLQANYTRNTLASLNGTQCTKDNIAVRRSWEDLSKHERTKYISAVKCLHSLPSKTDPTLVPGARNRLDDFTWAHINQTNFIHASGLFLPWHRVFMRSYEIALSTECNYTGTQPYWDWAYFTNDQTKSALFDGSDTSLGGNGEAVPHPVQSALIPGLPTPIPVQRDPGTGGGCVTDGPLAQPTFTINLGPVSPLVPGFMEQPNTTANDTFGNQYNPRCLKRDFLNVQSTGNLSWSNITDLMLTPSIHEFHPLMEQHMHPASHSFIGADAFDLFSSPSDPAFYFLHTQFDRLWAIWQGQDPAARTYGLDGTHTFFNDPPSANVTLDDFVDLGVVGGEVLIKSVMSPTQGPFCYMYA